MKNLFSIVFVLILCDSFSQKSLPLIKANSKQALIIENGQETKWSLSPETKPDVHLTTKAPTGILVKFKTDIDSISVKLRSGKSFDFVVLLNGTDSCFTRIQCPEIKNFSKIRPEIHDTIPFVLTEYNNIRLKVILNEKDTLYLKFDSGTTDFLLTRDVIKNKLGLKDLSNNSFQIGKQKFKEQEIYPVELTGQHTDGRFGWNLFDGKIVEIDYEKNTFIIHSNLKKQSSLYEKFNMEYAQGLFCIPLELVVKNKKYRCRFLFDTGYQRTIMLDDELMEEQEFPKDSLEVIRKVVMQNGQGKNIPVVTVNNDELDIGKFMLNSIPAQLLTTDNPAGFKTHILGNEVLKRFNAILDFQKNVVYLKPNSLYSQPYAEQKK